MPDSSLSIISRRLWRRIWHHRLLYFRHGLLRWRGRSQQSRRRWILALVALALATFEISTGQIIDGFTAVAAQAKINRVPCYQWPTIDEIERVLAENPEIIRRIEIVPPSGASVAISTWHNS